MRGDRTLEGVDRLELAVKIVLPGAAPVTKSYNERSFPGQVACPAGCHQGGYDLGAGLMNAGLARHRPSFKGVVRCRGFVAGHGGARQPCAGVAEFAGRAAYAFGW